MRNRHPARTCGITRTHCQTVLLLLPLLFALPATQVSGQNVAGTAESAAAEREKEKQQARSDAFDKRLSGSILEGRFSIDGQEGDLKQERYEIADVSPIPGSDRWLFKTRIRYGDHDVTVPLVLPVKWAGETPVIVVNKVAIPGLGTFDASVVIDGDRYAGTWQHDDVGGHLFGRVLKAEDAKKSDKAEETGEADKSEADKSESDPAEATDETDE
jgi:hypothetical protein